MVTSSPVSIGGGSVTTIVTETLAEARVLMTVDGYSKILEALDDADGGSIMSETFRVGGHPWYIEYCRFDFDDEDEEEDGNWVGVYLFFPDPIANEVKARNELVLLDHDGGIITSIQNLFTFSIRHNCIRMQKLNASPLLKERFQIRFDLTVIEEAAAAPQPDLQRHLGGLLASQVGVDVTFHVGGEMFTAHRCVLAARSPVFMAELFEENAAAATTGTHVRIDDMQPRVFRALLHFIYTDTLPEVKEGDDDTVSMAQDLLVAADRYDVEKLKSICSNMLCTCINARTAMTLLQLADSHGCRRLKQACIRVIKDMLAKVATP